MRGAEPAGVRVLGIDPGSQRTGFGVLDAVGPRLTYVASGVIRTQKGEFAARLCEIFRCVQTIVAQYRPQEIAIERVFVNRNPDSALKLGQARGAAICGTADANAEVFEYATRQIKQAVVGSGSAEKAQVQLMMKSILSSTDRSPPMRPTPWPRPSAMRCGAACASRCCARRAAGDRISQGPAGGQATALSDGRRQRRGLRDGSADVDLLWIAGRRGTGGPVHPSGGAGGCAYFVRLRHRRRAAAVSRPAQGLRRGAENRAGHPLRAPASRIFCAPSRPRTSPCSRGFRASAARPPNA